MPAMHTHMLTVPSPILLTGATGFIGRRLTARLAARHTGVAALLHPDDPNPPPADVQIWRGDITDPTAVSHAVQAVRPALVIHLAAVGVANTGLPFAKAMQVNVGGIINLLAATREVGTVKRLMLTGTSYEYGARRSDDGLDPFNAYSASKTAAWAFARAAYNAWNIPTIWLRPFQVYGAGQHSRALIPAAIHAALTNTDFRMTAGQQQRDFIHVDDIVAGFMAAAVAPDIEGRALDLGTGTLHSIQEVVNLIWHLTGASGNILAGALPYRPGEVSAIPADVSRTYNLTGWQAKIGLEEGLKQAIQSTGGP